MNKNKYDWLKNFDRDVLWEFRKKQYEGQKHLIGYYDLWLSFMFHHIITDKGIADKIKMMSSMVFEKLFECRTFYSFEDVNRTVYLLLLSKVNDYYMGKDYDRDTAIDTANIFQAVLSMIEKIDCKERAIFRMSMYLDDDVIAQYAKIPVEDVTSRKEAVVSFLSTELPPQLKAFFLSFIHYHGGFSYCQY